eukprot:29596-Pelagococcus_subviridis.AAC.1
METGDVMLAVDVLRALPRGGDHRGDVARFFRARVAGDDAVVLRLPSRPLARVVAVPQRGASTQTRGLPSLVRDVRKTLLMRSVAAVALALLRDRRRGRGRRALHSTSDEKEAGEDPRVGRGREEEHGGRRPDARRAAMSSEPRSKSSTQLERLNQPLPVAPARHLIRVRVAPLRGDAVLLELLPELLHLPSRTNPRPQRDPRRPLRILRNLRIRIRAERGGDVRARRQHPRVVRRERLVHDERLRERTPRRLILVPLLAAPRRVPPVEVAQHGDVERGDFGSFRTSDDIGVELKGVRSG